MSIVTLKTSIEKAIIQDKCELESTYTTQVMRAALIEYLGEKPPRPGARIAREYAISIQNLWRVAALVSPTDEQG